MTSRSLMMALLASIYGISVIRNGFQSYRKSHFPFYWITGLLIGVPFLVAGGLVVFAPAFRSPLMEAAVFLVWISAEAWRQWRQRKIQQEQPELWQSSEQVEM